MSFRVKKLIQEADLPVRGSKGAAGYDLTSTEECTILPNRRAVVATGISVKVPEGTYGRIAPRSGLAVTHGIQVGAGVIDSDYTGELKVVLFNHNNKKYNIKPGFRIAQLILEQCVTPEVVEVDDLDTTDRGSNGFGSTGVSVPVPTPIEIPSPPIDTPEITSKTVWGDVDDE
jgi:dUTP pyrophosphatase